jgi:hypothetical protein
VLRDVVIAAASRKRSKEKFENTWGLKRQKKGSKDLERDVNDLKVELYDLHKQFGLLSSHHDELVINMKKLKDKNDGLITINKELEEKNSSLEERKKGRELRVSSLKKDFKQMKGKMQRQIAFLEEKVCLFEETTLAEHSSREKIPILCSKPTDNKMKLITFPSNWNRSASEEYHFRCIVCIEDKRFDTVKRVKCPQCNAELCIDCYKDIGMKPVYKSQMIDGEAKDVSYDVKECPGCMLQVIVREHGDAYSIKETAQPSFKDGELYFRLVYNEPTACWTKRLIV